MENQLSSKVTSIVTDYYGHHVAVSAEDGKITIFSSSNMNKIGEIKIQGRVPSCISFSTNEYGPQIAIGFNDGQIFIYLRSGNSYNKINEIVLHNACITSLSFHSAKCILAASSLDGTFSVHQYSSSEGKWHSSQVSSGKLGFTCLTWGPESSDFRSYRSLFLGGVDGTISIYSGSDEYDSWELRQIIQVHDGWVRSIASPSSAGGVNQKAASIGEDNVLSVVKMVDNKYTSVSVEVGSSASGVSWAMVDKTILVSHDDGTVSMWKEDESGGLYRFTQE